MFRGSIILVALVWCVYGDSNDNTCKCGISNRKRIVSGEDAGEHEFPWQVKFERGNKAHNCGGTILSSNTILTAAHCSSTNIRVLVNRHKYGPESDEILLNICNVTRHPKYVSYYFYDLAIWTTCEEIPFSKMVGPICLPTTQGRGKEYEQVDAVVSGWGKTWDIPNIPEVLKKAKVKTMSNEDCLKYRKNNESYTVTDLQNISLCAFGDEDRVCYGDSGGPLMFEEESGFFTLIGVVSWGRNTCNQGLPQVYARVTEALDWIKQQITGETCQRQTAEPTEGVLIIGGVHNDVWNKVKVFGTCDLSSNNHTSEVVLARAAVLGKQIYICGGQVKNHGDVASCIIRDMDGSEKTGPSMKYSKHFFTLNTVGSKLVAVGGFGSAERVEVLNQGEDMWSTMDYTIKPGRLGHCAVTISSKSIMLIGGKSNLGYINTTEELDIETGSVTRYAAIPTPNSYHECSLFQNKIFLAGGRFNGKLVYSLDFSSAGSVWVAEEPMVKARMFHSMEVVNGVLTVYGGYSAFYMFMEKNIDGKWMEEELDEPIIGSASVVISC